MEIKTFLRVKKVEPKDIAKKFTKENEKYSALNNYSYIEDYSLKKMNNCEKFAKVRREPPNGKTSVVWARV